MEFNGTFFATIITFIVFVFVMNKILYRPVLDIMEQRQRFIDSNYKDARENDSKANELSEEKESKFDDAKDEARSKYIETVDDFKNQKADIIADAQNAANEELEKSRENLKSLSDEVKEGLKGSMNDLANDIVEKVIGYRTESQGFDNDKVNEVLWGEGK